MSSLPKVQWTIDPVFLQVPKPLVLAIAGSIAAYGLIQGLRRKGNDHYTTAFLFGALTFAAWQWMGEALELRYYSLLFVGVFLGGYSLLRWQIERGGGPAQDAGDFIVYGVLGVLVGARLGHVLFYDLDKALADPVWVLRIWTGGLASHGAVIGLIFAMWLFTKQRGIPFIEGADRFAFSAALGATLVRIGNLMNSEIIGRVVPDQSWGFAFKRLEGETAQYRYPTQLGEIALGLLVMACLYGIDRRLGKEKRPRGVLIASFFAIYFAGRFVIEFWKEYEGISSDSPLTMGQILSIPGFLIGVVGLVLAFKKNEPAGWPASEPLEQPEPRAKKPKKKRKGARKGDHKLAKPAPKAAAPTAEHDDDEDDDEELDEKAPSESSELATSKARDTSDDEADDDGDGDDDDDDDPKADRDDDADAADKSPSHDPDIDDEFDADGKLKRRRGGD